MAALMMLMSRWSVPRSGALNSTTVLVISAGSRSARQQSRSSTSSLRRTSAASPKHVARFAVTCVCRRWHLRASAVLLSVALNRVIACQSAAAYPFDKGMVKFVR